MRSEKYKELKGYIEDLKVELEKVSSNKHFITTESYKCTLLNQNRTFTREKILKNGNDGSAVIILPVLENNEILTVIEPRVFTKNKIGIGFPSGYIENNEKSEVAALRELKEETGYVPDSDLVPLCSFYQDEGCSSALNHSFLAFNCKKVGNQSLDGDEFIKYMTFNYKELLELVECGLINGANTLLTFEKAKKYLKRR